MKPSGLSPTEVVLFDHFYVGASHCRCGADAMDDRPITLAGVDWHRRHLALELEALFARRTEAQA